MTGVERHDVDVVVVGGGPAGLAAAHAAAEMGAEAVLLDLFGALGGQYHMQPVTPDTSVRLGRQALDGRSLAERARMAGARLESGAEVFWAERQGTVFGVHAVGDDRPMVFNAAALVVATGAMERPIPFRGWTLPGVTTAGAAQRLIKTAGRAPGSRVVLAGSGPFLLAVAATFADAGLPLAAYVEYARPGVADLTLLARHPRRAHEALRLLRGLAKTRAERRFGWAVHEAIGQGRVEAVRIAPVRADGRLDPSRSKVVEGVDALCVGYGFKPVIDLTALLNADHRYDGSMGGWVCTASPESGATNVPGLFAAGETTGVGGAVAARLSGRLAGRHAAAHAGRVERGAPAESRTVAELDRARAFAAGLAAVFPFPQSLIATVPEVEIVCRCEDVTRAAISAAIADGAQDASSVKMWTRAGMGPCQGRVCASAIAEILSADLGIAPADAGFNRPHLPLRPVPLKIVEATFAARGQGKHP